MTTPSTDTTVCFATASDLLDGYRRREYKPSEVLTDHFAQIDRTNPATALGVNALTQEMRETSMNSALAADEAYARGGQLPPLLGVPLVTKEKHAITGLPVTQGLGTERAQVPTANQAIVQRVLDAGVVLHARTTTPEFSCASVTHSKQWGVTRTPWNLQAGPGGSSGGAGAALAAGMSTLATASDIGGSTRIPAGFNGLVGYKAPYGRVPGAAPLSADWYRSDGPMARSVADVALLQSVMAGRHASDHASWGDHGSDYLSHILAGNVESIRGVRIAYSPTLGGFPVAASIRANTEALVARLMSAGVHVDLVEPQWSVEQVLDAIFSHFGAIMGRALLQQVGGDPEELSGYAQLFVAQAADAAGRGTLVDSLAKDAVIQQELAGIMEGYDVLLTPTQGAEMLPADGNFTDGITLEGRHFENYMAAHMTMPFNVANRCPVMALPTGLSGVGVPTSVQVVGHPFDEAMVFRISAAIEAISEPLGRPDGF
ncbi:amidase [Arthrobacter oryzae]|uniref:amidase n=1 Tax=Arthrobacter oryzae TaxID=409290 RepID=UPI002863327E|nr:amidase [Arthrobacter oryzae]MDR6508427.1 aspartyl-tRNA(Asn)/glutamyl-tRNA(Gln) amidotransferase subunit A [Arthrobacter oryzae]